MPKKRSKKTTIALHKSRVIVVQAPQDWAEMVADGPTSDKIQDFLNQIANQESKSRETLHSKRRKKTS